MLKGTHCQSNTYQSYQPSSFCANPSAQPVSHQYTNRNTHQMQSGMSYSSGHHAASYVSSQSQYGSMNQGTYGNPQSSYTNDNHSMQQVKPIWGTCSNNGNTNDVMQSYCQPAHSPVVNPAHCMPSLSMRSPPHEITNASSQSSSTSHCYRQVPIPSLPSQPTHSWTHSQIPNSLMFHSSCTASSVANHTQQSSNCQPFMPSTTAQMPAAVSSPAPQSEAIAHIAVTESGPSVHGTSQLVAGQEISSLQPLQGINMLDSKPEISLVVQPSCNTPCSSEQSPVHAIPPHLASADQHGNSETPSPYPTYYNLDQNDMCTSPNSLSNLSCSVVGSVSCTSEASESSASAVDVNSPLTDGLNGVLNDTSSPSSRMKCDLSFTSDLNKINDSKLHLEDIDGTNRPPEKVDAKPIGGNCFMKENFIESESSKAETLSNISTTELDKEYSEQEKADVSNLLQVTSEQTLESNMECTGEESDEKKLVDNVTNGNLESEHDTSLTDSINPHTNSPTDTTCNEVQNEQPKTETFSESSEVKSEPNEGVKHNLRRRKCAVSYQETPPEWDSKFVFGINETSTPRNKYPTTRLSDRRKKNKLGDHNVLPNKETTVKNEPVCGESTESNNLSTSTSSKQSSQTSDHCSETESIPSEQVLDEKVNCDELSSLIAETPLHQADEHHSPPQIIVLSPALEKKMGTSKSAMVPEEKTVSQGGGGGGGSNRKQPNKKRSMQSSQSEESPDAVNKKKKRPNSNRNRLKSQTDKKKKAAKKKKPNKKAPAVETNESVKVKKKAFSGPYIHITGTKARPLSVTVVNVPVKEVEKDVKYPRQKRDYNIGGNLRKKMHVGHTSTLSPFYDAFTKDKTWVCAFCHNGSHFCGLGDLYGPYYLSEDLKLNDQTNNSLTQMSVDSVEEKNTKDKKNVIGTPAAEETLVSSRRIRSKRKRSELVEEFFKSTMSKKSKQIKKSNSQTSQAIETTQVQPTVSPLPQPPDQPVTPQHLPENSTSDSTSSREFWVHEDCAVWSHGIYIMSQRIYGLEDAVKEASNMVCSKCKLSGATLGCWKKGCTEQYHFVCAKQRGCEMNEENLFVVCVKHQKRYKPEK